MNQDFKGMYKRNSLSINVKDRTHIKTLITELLKLLSLLKIIIQHTLVILVLNILQKILKNFLIIKILQLDSNPEPLSS